MIKFTRFVSISLLVPTLFVIAYFFGKLKEITILFIIITIHEFSHVIAALIFKAKVNEIVLTPIGVIAKIKYGLNSALHELFIAISGPASNVFMAACGWYINSYYLDNSEFMSFFILSNISLAAINLLPVLPLDGGRIFKGFLLGVASYNNCIKVFSTMSKGISILLIVIGIYQFINNWYNVSLLCIGIFIFILADRERQNIQYEMILELLNKRKKIDKFNIMKVCQIACSEDTKLIDLIKNFYKDKYHVVLIMSGQLEYMTEIREEEIFKFLEIYGCDVTAGEICKLKNLE